MRSCKTANTAFPQLRHVSLMHAAPKQLERIVLTVRTTLSQVFTLAEAEGITTNVAAERLAQQRIAEGATAAGGS